MNLKQLATRMVIAVAAIWAGMAAAETQIETGFLDRAVVVDGQAFPYQVYVPRAFRASAKWPVILALHGGGEYGQDGIRQTGVGLANAIRRYPERVPAIVVFPQAPADGTPAWQHAAGDAALAALDQSIAEFSGDPSRVYLTGYSAGGNGSWLLASHHPERFAALVVVCGFVSEFHGHIGNILYPALTPSAADPFAALAKRVADLPIWLFHGDADTTVPVTESRQMFAALKALAADVRYTELPGVAHDAWTPAYDRADLFEWLLAQRRR